MIIEKCWGTDKGAMIAIEDDFVGTKTTPAQFLQPFQAEHPNAVIDIACHNGPNNYVLAGTTADIRLLESYLSQKKAENRKLRFKFLTGMYAYHSYLADSIVEESAKLSTSVQFQVSLNSEFVLT